MRLPREVEAILAHKPCCSRHCSNSVIEAGLRGLAEWLLCEEACIFWAEDAGDVALSLLMSEAAGGEL